MRHIVLAGAILAAAALPAQAQEFYAGKTMTIIVSTGAGGSYYQLAQAFSRHMPKYIPGQPTIIVKAMPGAGNLLATNFLHNIAPKDGTTIGTINNSIPLHQGLGGQGVHFDSRKFHWLGSTGTYNSVAYVWHTAGIKTFKDVMTREMVLGASGTATSDSVYPRLMNEMIGTKFKVIDGYKDNPSMILATESGEIMGRGGWFLSSLMSTQGQQLKDGKLTILAQVALEKHPDLPNVPLVTEFITDKDKRAKLEFSLSWLPMGRPFVAPPGVPADRLKILRDSFIATARDPELLAEAKKMSLEISPLTGEETQAMVAKFYETPKDVIESVRAIMVPQKK